MIPLNRAAIPARHRPVSNTLEAGIRLEESGQWLAHGVGLAQRPRDDPQARWLATEAAIFSALAQEGALDKVVDVPGMGQSPVNRLLPTLTTDVLIHTWDLARAVGADDALDPELCRLAYERALPFDEVLRSSGMFGAKVAVPAGADQQTKLVAFFGRDPNWKA